MGSLRRQPAARTRGRRARRPGPLAAVLLIGAACFVAAVEGGVPGQVRLMSAVPPVSTATPALASLPVERRGDGGRLPTDSPAYRAAHRLLPPRFRDHETERFVVISDAAERWTREQGRLLERTWHEFRRFTRRIRARPRPLRHKLVCVLFRDHGDYLRFARDHDGVTAEWISGYYSPRHDRIVFYDLATHPDFGAAPDGAAPTRVAARARADEEFAGAAVATVIHEAVHQLAFHTRLQSPHIQNPLWLSEGLATAFETDRPLAVFGPDRGFDLRDELFEQLLHADALLPLEELVTCVTLPDHDDGNVAAVYHQSYALVSWMSRFRRGDLRRYLRLLRQEPSGRPSARRHLELFEEAFGDIDGLETDWLRHMRSETR